MAGFSVDDPSWGAIFGDLASGFDPARRERARLLGQTYAKNQMEMEKQRLLRDAAAGVTSATMADWDLRNPPGILPTPEGSQVPFEGPLSPQQQAEQDINRRRLSAMSTQAANLASNPRQVMETGFGLPMANRLFTGGVPADRGQRDQMEAFLGQVGMSIPGYEQSKMPLHPFTETDLATGQVRRGLTQNGAIDVNGQPIGGAGKQVELHQLTPANAKGVEDKGYRAQILLDAAERLRRDPNAQFSGQRLDELAIAWNTEFGSKTKINEKTGRQEQIKEVTPPIELAPVLDLIMRRQGGPAAPQPPTVAPPVPPPAPTTIAPQPDALAGAQPAAPAAPAAAPAAAAPPPIVPPNAVAQRRPGFAYGDEQTTGASGPATHEATLLASRVASAQNARGNIAQRIGFNPQTGVLNSNYYVPGLMAQAIDERYGGGILGQAAAAKLDPKAAEYRNEGMLWIENVLRTNSGAAVPPAEAANYFRMFIPNAVDSREEVVRKLKVMELWEYAAANSATAAGALDMMERVGRGDPAIQQAVSRLRNTPDNAAGGTSAPAPSSAPTPTTVPPQTMSREDYRKFADGL